MLPDKFKLEIETQLESFFFGGALLCGLITFVTLFICFKHGFRSPSTVILGTGGTLLALFICLYSMTDNFYVVDRSSKLVLYHFKFLLFRKVSTICRFSDISLVTTGGQYNKSKQGTWWAYAAYILTTDGRLVRISDNDRDEFDKQQQLAKKISDITGAKFVSATKEKVVKVNGLNSVRHEDHTPATPLVEPFLVVFGALGFLLLTAVVMNLVGSLGK